MVLDESSGDQNEYKEFSEDHERIHQISKQSIQ